MGKSYLHPQNAKDDKESTTDQDNVADRPERRDQRLDHEFQTWSSADDPGEERTSFFHPNSKLPKKYLVPRRTLTVGKQQRPLKPYFITVEHSGQG